MLSRARLVASFVLGTLLSLAASAVALGGETGYPLPR